LNKAIEMRFKHNEGDNISICSATSNSSLCSVENPNETHFFNYLVNKGL
jgi:hypothetical protein